MQRAVIIGGCGFLGRSLMTEFSRSGWASESFDRREGCDLLASGAAERLAKSQPRLIVHAGGLYGNHEESQLRAANVDSTEMLLAAVAKCSPYTRVVLIGSAAEFGVSAASAGMVEEAENGHPNSPYGVSKLQQSMLARDLAVKHGLDVLRVRVFNTLGPGQSPALVGGAMVGRFFERIAAGVAELTVSDPESVRDFLDVRDVARLVRIVGSELEKEPQRIPVNICSGIGTSIAALAGELAAAVGSPVRFRFEPSTKPSRIVGIPRTLRQICGEGTLCKISSYQSMRDMWVHHSTRVHTER